MAHSPIIDPATDSGTTPAVQANETLDPADWAAFRVQAHRMLDDMLGYVEEIRERPVWQPIPAEVRARFRSAAPHEGRELAEVHAEFMRNVLPYAQGNVHPGFMGWVNGGGTPVGMVAEMLAAGLNANCGGRDHIPVEVERQVTRWVAEIFGFPETATGLFVTGTSMANLIAVLVARDAALGVDVRATGVAAAERRLTAYTSNAVHGCVPKAMDIAGLGSDALRQIATDSRFRMDLTALAEAIQRDREAGLTPFMVVGTAGTVNTGAVDDLAALAESLRTRESFGSMWTEHLAHWPGLRPIWLRCSTALSARIRWLLTFTNGGRHLTTRASFWCAMAKHTRRPSRFRRLICSAPSGDWPPTRPGLAISVQISRAAFAP
jgi:hypothetical protein